MGTSTIGNDDLTIKLRADDGNFAAITQSSVQQLDRLAASAGGMAQSLARSGEGAKLTRQQMQSLNYTMSDVTASLASGISPLTVLLQQGPQLRDAFGGIGNALRELLGLLTPMNVLLGTVGVATGGLALAAYQGATEMREFGRSLTLTGNASGMTADQLTSLASRVSDASRQTVGEARSIVRELTANGQVSGRVIESMARAVAALADTTGGDSKKIASDFAGMSNGVAKWAAEHNKAWNFITVEQFKYIQRLEAQGRAEQAAIVVNEQLVRHLRQQPEQLGYIERTLDLAARAWSRFWNAAMNGGRPQTVADRLEETRARMDQLQARLQDTAEGALVRTPEGVRPARAQLLDQIKSEQATFMRLMRQMDEANVGAFTKSEEAAKNRSGIAALMGSGSRSGAAKKDEFIGVPDAELRAEQKERWRIERDSILELFRGSIADDDARRRQLDQATQFGQQMVTATDGINAQMIRGAEARGQALLAIEKAQLTSKLAQLKVEGEQRKLLEDEVDRYMVARQAQLTEELKPEWQRMVEAWADTTEAMKRTSDQFLTGFVNQGRTVFEQFAMTGKLSMASLANFVRAQFAQMFYDRFVAASVANFGSFLFNSLFGSTGGGGAGAGASYALPSVGIKLGGGAASGTNFVERDMLTILHKGEAVIPKPFNPAASGPAAGGPVVNITQTINVGGGASRADMVVAAAAAKDAAVAQIADMLRRGHPALAG